MAGLRLPIESHVLQAFVTEGIKPLIDRVITFGAGHFYISQSDKGGLVFGGDIDGYNSYAQRGNLPTVEDVCEGGMALMPMIGRAARAASWGGIVDMSMDGSPIIDRTPIEGLYLNAGWCYGGFKATPASGWCFAHLIARDEPHPVAAAYRLDRFASGPPDRRAGRRRPTESALSDPHAHPLSLLRRARRPRVHLSRRCDGRRVPIRNGAGRASIASSTMSICATIRPAPHREFWYHGSGCQAGSWSRATRALMRSCGAEPASKARCES